MDSGQSKQDSQKDYFQTIIRKYEDRNTQFRERQCDLRHRLEAIECSMPALMCFNVLQAKSRPPVNNECDNDPVKETPSKISPPGNKNVRNPRNDINLHGCNCNPCPLDPNYESALRSSRTAPKPNVNVRNDLNMQNCDCNPCPIDQSAQEKNIPLQNAFTSTASTAFNTRSISPAYENMSTADDMQYMTKIKELAENEKKLREEIEELEHKERAYTETLKQSDDWSGETNHNGAGDYEIQTLKRMNQEIEFSNKALEEELEEVKQELKHIHDTVEIPIRKEIENEKNRCISLEEQLNRHTADVSNREATHRKKVVFLERQLQSANRNLNDLHVINKRLKEELCLLNCRCNELQDDLINQKISEIHTVSRMTAKKEKVYQPPLPKPVFSLMDTSSGDDLNAIARNLSNLLNEATACSNCKQTHPDLIDTVQYIKELVDIVNTDKKASKLDRSNLGDLVCECVDLDKLRDFIAMEEGPDEQTFAIFSPHTPSTESTISTTTDEIQPVVPSKLITPKVSIAIKSKKSERSVDTTKTPVDAKKSVEDKIPSKISSSVPDQKEAQKEPDHKQIEPEEPTTETAVTEAAADLSVSLSATEQLVTESEFLTDVSEVESENEDILGETAGVDEEEKVHDVDEKGDVPDASPEDEKQPSVEIVTEELQESDAEKFGEGEITEMEYIEETARSFGEEDVGPEESQKIIEEAGTLEEEKEELESEEQEELEPEEKEEETKVEEKEELELEEKEEEPEYEERDIPKPTEDITTPTGESENEVEIDVAYILKEIERNVGETIEVIEPIEKDTILPLEKLPSTGKEIAKDILRTVCTCIPFEERHLCECPVERKRTAGSPKVVSSELSEPTSEKPSAKSLSKETIEKSSSRASSKASKPTSEMSSTKSSVKDVTAESEISSKGSKLASEVSSAKASLKDIAAEPQISSKGSKSPTEVSSKGSKPASEVSSTKTSLKDIAAEPQISSKGSKSPTKVSSKESKPVSEVSSTKTSLKDTATKRQISSKGSKSPSEVSSAKSSLKDMPAEPETSPPRSKPTSKQPSEKSLPEEMKPRVVPGIESKASIKSPQKSQLSSKEPNVKSLSKEKVSSAKLLSKEGILESPSRSKPTSKEPSVKSMPKGGPSLTAKSASQEPSAEDMSKGESAVGKVISQEVSKKFLPKDGTPEVPPDISSLQDLEQEIKSEPSSITERTPKQVSEKVSSQKEPSIDKLTSKEPSKKSLPKEDTSESDMYLKKSKPSSEQPSTKSLSAQEIKGAVAKPLSAPSSQEASQKSLSKKGSSKTSQSQTAVAKISSIQSEKGGRLVTDIEAEGDIPVEAEIEVITSPSSKSSDSLYVTTAVTSSGHVEVTTEGPTGVVETKIKVTESGNVEVITGLKEFDKSSQENIEEIELDHSKPSPVVEVLHPPTGDLKESQDALDTQISKPSVHEYFESVTQDQITESAKESLGVITEEEEVADVKAKEKFDREVECQCSISKGNEAIQIIREEELPTIKAILKFDQEVQCVCKVYKESETVTETVEKREVAVDKEEPPPGKRYCECPPAVTECECEKGEGDESEEDEESTSKDEIEDTTTAPVTMKEEVPSEPKVEPVYQKMERIKSVEIVEEVRTKKICRNDDEDDDDEVKSGSTVSDISLFDDLDMDTSGEPQDRDIFPEDSVDEVAREELQARYSKRTSRSILKNPDSSAVDPRHFFENKIRISAATTTSTADLNYSTCFCEEKKEKQREKEKEIQTFGMEEKADNTQSFLKSVPEDRFGNTTVNNLKIIICNRDTCKTYANDEESVVNIPKCECTKENQPQQSNVCNAKTCGKFGKNQQNKPSKRKSAENKLLLENATCTTCDKTSCQVIKSGSHYISEDTINSEDGYICPDTCPSVGVQHTPKRVCPKSCDDVRTPDKENTFNQKKSKSYSHTVCSSTCSSFGVQKDDSNRLQDQGVCAPGCINVATQKTSHPKRSIKSHSTNTPKSLKVCTPEVCESTISGQRTVSTYYSCVPFEPVREPDERSSLQTPPVQKKEKLSTTQKRVCDAGTCMPDPLTRRKSPGLQKRICDTAICKKGESKTGSPSRKRICNTGTCMEDSFSASDLLNVQKNICDPALCKKIVSPIQKRICDTGTCMQDSPSAGQLPDVQKQICDPAVCKKGESKTVSPTQKRICDTGTCMQDSPSARQLADVQKQICDPAICKKGESKTVSPTQKRICDTGTCMQDSPSARQLADVQKQICDPAVCKKGESRTVSPTEKSICDTGTCMEDSKPTPVSSSYKKPICDPAVCKRRESKTVSLTDSKPTPVSSSHKKPICDPDKCRERFKLSLKESESSDALMKTACTSLTCSTMQFDAAAARKASSPASSKPSKVSKPSNVASEERISTPLGSVPGTPVKDKMSIKSEVDSAFSDQGTFCKSDTCTGLQDITPEPRKLTSPESDKKSSARTSASKLTSSSRDRKSSIRSSTSKLTSPEDDKKPSTRSSTSKLISPESDKKSSARSSGSKLTSPSSDRRSSARSSTSKLISPEGDNKSSTHGSTSKLTSPESDKKSSVRSSASKLTSPESDKKSSVHSSTSKLTSPESDKKSSVRSSGSKLTSPESDKKSSAHSSTSKLTSPESDKKSSVRSSASKLTSPESDKKSSARSSASKLTSSEGDKKSSARSSSSKLTSAEGDKKSSAHSSARKISSPESDKKPSTLISARKLSDSGSDKRSGLLGSTSRLMSDESHTKSSLPSASSKQKSGASSPRTISSTASSQKIKSRKADLDKSPLICAAEESGEDETPCHAEETPQVKAPSHKGSDKSSIASVTASKQSSSIKSKQEKSIVIDEPILEEKSRSKAEISDTSITETGDKSDTSKQYRKLSDADDHSRSKSVSIDEESKQYKEEEKLSSKISTTSSEAKSPKKDLSRHHESSLSEEVTGVVDYKEGKLSEKSSKTSEERDKIFPKKSSESEPSERKASQRSSGESKQMSKKSSVSEESGHKEAPSKKSSESSEGKASKKSSKESKEDIEGSEEKLSKGGSARESKELGSADEKPSKASKASKESAIASSKSSASAQDKSPPSVSETSIESDDEKIGEKASGDKIIKPKEPPDKGSKASLLSTDSEKRSKIPLPVTKTSSYRKELHQGDCACALCLTEEGKAPEHPTDCDCVDCLCDPSKFRRKMSEIKEGLPEKRLETQHTPSCTCIDCLYEPQKTSPKSSEMQKPPSSIATVETPRHSSSCECIDCLCVPSDIEAPAMIERSKEAVYVCPSIPPVKSKHHPDCKCRKCVCDPCGHRPDCSCKLCKCDPCKDELVEFKKHPPECSCPDCICAPCGDAEMERKKEMQKLEQLEKLEQHENLEELEKFEETVFVCPSLPPVRSKHHPDCACPECICDPCNRQPDCSCKLCRCDPCKDEIVQFEKHPPDCTCPDCICAPCGDKNVEMGREVAKHPPDCDCAECICEPCTDEKVQSQKDAKHPKDCNCTKCICDPCNDEKVQAQKEPPPPPPAPPEKHIEDGDCTCEECLCDPCDDPKVKPPKSCKDCGCIICICDPCEDPRVVASRQPHPPSCNCVECLCNPCSDKTKIRAHPPGCTCRGCICNPCKSTAKQHGPSCKCPTCVCDPCSDIEKKRSVHGRDCTCVKCICNPCEKKPDSGEKHSPNCKCSLCKRPAGKHGPACDCPTCVCDPCSDPKKKKLVHGPDCTCAKCICNPCKRKPDPAEKHSSNCKCSICKRPGEKSIPVESTETHGPNCKCKPCKRKRRSAAKSLMPEKDLPRIPEECPECDCSPICVCDDCPALRNNTAPSAKTMKNETLQKNIKDMEKENARRENDMNELKGLMSQIRCACQDAEKQAIRTVPPEPKLMQKASTFRNTLSGLQLAMNTLEEKCKMKDKMIDAMTQELRLRANSNVFNEMLRNMAGYPPVDVDFDRHEICDSLPRPIDDPKYGRPSYRYIETVPDLSCICKDVPVSMKITSVKQISPNSILIKWTQPASDQVLGYEVSINNVLKSRIHSAQRTSTVVFAVEVKTKLNISVYAVTQYGRCEPPATCTYGS